MEPAKPARHLKVEIDFACPEETIKRIVDVGDALIAEAYEVSVELGTAEVNLKQLEANAGITVRNSREKCTEGLVASMVDADANVCDARKGVERLQAQSNAIRLAVDNLHDTRRMFVAWMAMQKQAGVTD